MAKTLAIIAILMLVLTLGSTLVAIWWDLNPKDDLLKLAELILSWEVIAGGLVVGAGSSFRTAIEDRLRK